MSQTKDEIIKRNLEFVYGKNKQEMQYDLDKVRHVRDRPTAADIDDSIVCFEGEYQCFLPAHPCEVTLDLIDTDPYPSFEHALLASKLSDQAERDHIRSFCSIIEAKRHISKLKGGRPEVFLDNWSDRCLSIAERLLMDKFIKNKQFAGALVGSKDKRIVYQNKFNDLFWGVDLSNLKNGSNHLGKLLVKIRSYFVSSQHISAWISSYISFIDGDKVRVVVNISHTPGAIGASSSSVSSDKKEDGMLLMGGGGESKVLDKIPKLLFGKSDECNVEALHPTISRQHMLLAVDRSLGPFIVDLNSSNGTFVAGTKLLPFKFCSYPADGINTITMGASTRKYSLQIDMRADIARQKELLAKIDKESSKELSGKDGENTVFVGNISFDASEQQLSVFFNATCGAILRLSMPKDRGSFTHKGIAFITFSHYSGVAKALMKDGEELQGRPLKVKRSSDNSRPKQNTTGSSSSSSSSNSSNRSDNTRKYSDDPKYGKTLDSSVVDRKAVVRSGQQRDDSSSYRGHRDDDREQKHRRDHHFDPPMVDRQRRVDSDRRDRMNDRDDSCDSRSKSKRGRSRDGEEEDSPRGRRRK